MLKTQGLDVREYNDANNSRLIIEGKDGLQVFRESSRKLDKSKKAVI